MQFLESLYDGTPKCLVRTVIFNDQATCALQPVGIELLCHAQQHLLSCGAVSLHDRTNARLPLTAYGNDPIEKRRLSPFKQQRNFPE